MRKLSGEDFISYIRCYDLILLSETWTSKKHTTDLEIQGYDSFHIYGHKSPGVRKGRQSGGISVYYRNCLKHKLSVVEQNNLGIIWLKLNGELFPFNEDIYICHTYIPPVCSKVLNENDFDFFEELEKGIEKFGKYGKTFITGDFNSRTGQLSDVLEPDRYLDKYFDSENNFDVNAYFRFSNVPSIRNNMDHIIDNNGRKLISLCKSTDHIIANGRLSGDQDGKHTFCSARGLSVTDYLLLNINDIMSIHNFIILDWNNFSDHAPVYFSFEKHSPRKTDTQDNCTYEQKIVFNEEKIPLFFLAKQIHKIIVLMSKR